MCTYTCLYVYLPRPMCATMNTLQLFLMQMLDMAGRLPDYVVACVGGGSNAIGMFHPFVGDVDAGDVKLVGVEAGGKGMDALNSATLTKGTPGVLHGTRTYLLQVSLCRCCVR